VESLAEFFDFLYGGESGFVYSPTKDPNSGDFEQYYFAWPVERVQLIEHIQRYTRTHEVYYGPSLFSSASATKEAFKGTNFVWCEFDGNAPDSLPDGFPNPSYKLQSSGSGNQHWYWKIDHFSSDIDLIESVSQRLAYHLEADLSCWNANRVLRPPGTRHHDSGLDTVELRRDEHHTHALGSFAFLPDLPVRFVKDGDIGYIPTPIKVINKYNMPEEDLEFFMANSIKSGKDSGTGKGRSAALAKLGHICMEMGMSNAESLSILLNADSRWGKFAKRKDRKERLLGIINYCRARHPIDPVEREVTSRLKVYTFEEFINTNIQLEWLIPDLLHRKGLLMLSGPPNVGKSQLSLRFCEKLAKGEPFLQWKIPRPVKTMFVSMEMPHEELHYALTHIMTIEGHELLRDNMFLMPVGSSVHLNSKIAQHELNKVIEEFQPDGIIFDSLGKGVGDEITSDKIILETFDYIDGTIRGEYGAFAWFIHHPRKGQIGNKKPNTLDDLYGSRFISAGVTTAVGLWSEPNSPVIDVDCLKLRLAPEFNSFQIRRTATVDFEIYENRERIVSSTGKSVFGEMGNDNY
jgi:hypothetical protein